MKPQDTDLELFHQEAPNSSPLIAPGEIIIGEIAGIDGQGRPLVNYAGNPAGQPQVAMSTLSITTTHAGRHVALLFAKGDPRTPVIMGLIHSSLHDLILAHGNQAVAPAGNTPAGATTSTVVDEFTVDGKRVVLEGKEEVVIKCGEASITLTRAGKILICGKYLLNRASGMNRIIGGSVQVN